MTTKLYEAAKKALRDFESTDLSNLPLEKLTVIASDFDPENNAIQARIRAERNLDLLLRGCWEIRQELNEAGIPTAYRLAVYKERLGVKRGHDAYQLMETTQ